MSGFLQAGLKYGWPAVALFLIWLLSQDVKSAATEQTSMLREHIAAAARQNEQIQTYLIDLLAAQHTTIDLLRQQCVNAAKTPYDRTACFEAGRGH